jgi:hypothetical protein
MAWSTPRTWVTSEIVTAAMMNSDVRDNSNFLHDTHGPLWIPAQAWSKGTTYALAALIGTDPDAYAVLNLANGIDANHHHSSALVPDKWISGGFTVKVHWTPSSTNTGDCRFELTYLFVSADGNPEAAGTTVPTDIAGGGVTTAKQVDTIATTSAPTAGQWMRLVLNRLGSADTFTGAARVVGLELEYT